MERCDWISDVCSSDLLEFLYHIIDKNLLVVAYRYFICHIHSSNILHFYYIAFPTKMQLQGDAVHLADATVCQNFQGGRCKYKKGPREFFRDLLFVISNAIIMQVCLCIFKYGTPLPSYCIRLCKRMRHSGLFR